ncbi:hypothetical protein [Euzebya pacifica]|uniref:hypothetical protein n=1 Tax=Euzebya pacifica TaxID=1608957 RepID=UPI0030FA873A
MRAAQLTAAVARLDDPASLDWLVGLPAPTRAGWARDGIWTDPDGPWPGDVRDPALVSLWTPTCARCDVGTRAVAVTVVADPDASSTEPLEGRPDVVVHGWLLDRDRILRSGTVGWCLDAVQPGLSAIRSLQSDVAAEWAPSELLRSR